MATLASHTHGKWKVLLFKAHTVLQRFIEHVLELWKESLQCPWRWNSRSKKRPMVKVKLTTWVNSQKAKNARKTRKVKVDIYMRIFWKNQFLESADNKRAVPGSLSYPCSLSISHSIGTGRKRGWFRARKVTGTFKKMAWLHKELSF